MIKKSLITTHATEDKVRSPAQVVSGKLEKPTSNKTYH